LRTTELACPEKIAGSIVLIQKGVTAADLWPTQAACRIAGDVNISELVGRYAAAVIIGWRADLARPKESACRIKLAYERVDVSRIGTGEVSIRRSADVDVSESVGRYARARVVVRRAKLPRPEKVARGVELAYEYVVKPRVGTAQVAAGIAGRINVPRPSVETARLSSNVVVPSWRIHSIDSACADGAHEASSDAKMSNRRDAVTSRLQKIANVLAVQVSAPN
jgi:hypothetical protein